MPNYYTYLISSLPLLRYGEKSPISFDRLASLCADLIPEEDAGLVGTIRDSEVYEYSGRQQTMQRWHNYEVSLRNELVKIRASRKHLDPAIFLRSGGESDISINHTAINAHRAVNPLESEKVLDQARWQALDEFSLGHYFDIDLLVTYTCKLKILEKWDRIKAANNAVTIEKVLV